MYKKLFLFTFGLLLINVVASHAQGTFQKNLMDVSVWSENTGAVGTLGSFVSNGGSTQNSIVWDTDPFGRKALIWKCISNGTAAYLGGQLSIGTVKSSDPNYKLFVEKGIRTRKVKVDQDTWPDYVFEEEYPLLTLNEVEKHIKEYRHLPEIPSAREIISEGLDLGEVNKKLLQKIEELTLYLIDQNKRLEAMEKLLEMSGKKTGNLKTAAGQ